MGSVPTKKLRSARKGTGSNYLPFFNTTVSVLGLAGAGKTELLLTKLPDITTEIESRPAFWGGGRYKDCVKARKKMIVTIGKKEQIEIETIWYEEGAYYYRGCSSTPSPALSSSDLIWIVFDVNNKDSLSHLPRWIKEVYRYAGDKTIFLIGTKADLPGDIFRITKEMLEKEGILSYQDNIWYFGETSCNNMEDMEMLFLVTILASHFPCLQRDMHHRLLPGFPQEKWRERFCPEIFLYTDDDLNSRLWIVLLWQLVEKKRATPIKGDPTADFMMALFGLPMDIFKQIVCYL